MPLQIIDFPVNDDKLSEVIGYLRTKFEGAVKARSEQIESKYRKWQDNYSAKPYEKVRTTPFYRASNFIPRLIGMHTDILQARTYGIIMGTRPFWKPRMMPDGQHEWLEALSQVLELWSFNEMKLHTLLDDGLMRAFKTGTVTCKAPWVEDEFYLGGQGSEIKVSTEGMQPRCIPFDDFFPYPITANNLTECSIKFHRIRLTKEEVQYRAARGWWDKAAAEKLLTTPVSGTGGVGGSRSNPTESKAVEAGINLTNDVDRPFSAIEAWYDYQLQNGKIYKLVTVFNPFVSGKEGCLRKYFNYYPKGEDPFFDLRPLPREDLYYGYAIPEVLEQSQEEQAQIHNVRRDASTIANTPGWKKKRYANVPNPSQEWYPGKCFELEDMTDLDIIQFPVKYNSMIEEENFVLQLAATYTGIGQPLQALGNGMMTGKRGIYNSQGTIALLSEGNRRLNVYLARLREGFHCFGNLIYQSHKAFRPDGQEYQVMGDKGQLTKQTFQFKEPEGYSGLFFDISSSDSGANREVDRTSLLLMANTMAAYYKEIIEITGLIAQSGPNNPLSQVMLSVLDGARDLANRLLFAFDVQDRKRLVPDVRNLLGGGNQPPQQPRGNGAAGPGNVPPTEQPLPVGALQELSQRLATISGGNPDTNGKGNGQGGFPTG